MTRLDRLTNFIIEFGVENQKLKILEELGELSDAIVEGNEVHIFQELVDVEIVLEQLKIIYKLDEKDLAEYKEFKMSRTEERMLSGYYELEKF